VITLHYDDGGILRTLDLAADSLRDLSPIFRRYVKWLRPEIDKVFQQQGPGWPPIAESTQEHRDQQLAGGLAAKIREGSIESLSKRMAGEQRKVGRRLASRLMESGAVARKLGEARGSKLLHSAEKSAQRQEDLRQKFERIRGASRTLIALGPQESKYNKLYERVGRAQERGENKIQKLQSGELLGNIARSITHEIKGGTLEVFSRIKWAGIHNDGGTAGHGARIPERKFLEWTPARVAKLGEIAQTYALEKLKGKQ